ncbi:hypothetical protein [Helicobacter sp.]|uniref:hypothetical protein n=1 Tax=Helicobacter sp. TaxID=218 RepID=UPI0025BEA6D0|nr:hypothetical protein [Helicobacter sp.]MCI5969335.1 hypothetical protein [Helicobacter sp.]MDY2585589.1 hypothetical protein [Helicobacter sp.]
MKLYLVSKNPIINKLVVLSTSKLGVEMVESQEVDINMSAELVLMDDECFEAESFTAYKAQNTAAKTILFYSKATERIEGFDTYIQKPFLPTDLVKTLSEISGISIEDNTKKSVESDILELDSSEDADVLHFDEELDFSNLDDLDLEGDKALNLESDEELLDGIDINVESKEEMEAQDAKESLGEEIEGDLQVLDKEDVDAIKDLLEDSEDSKEVRDDALPELDKEIGEIAEETEAMDLSGMADDAEEELEVIEQDDSNVAESKSAEVSKNVEMDLNAFDEEAQSQEAAEQEAMESENADLESLEDLDLENKESLENTELAESVEVIQTEDLEDLNRELSVEDSLNNPNAEEIINKQDAVVEDDLAGLSLEGVNLDVTDEDVSVESNTEATDEIPLDKTDSAMDLISGDDTFDALSLEDMGEALGEAIQKDPIPVPIPILTKDTLKDKEAQFPSSIQANSLESLISTLQTLQTQALKDLLSGATINISIQFPKKDEKE